MAQIKKNRLTEVICWIGGQKRQFVVQDEYAQVVLAALERHQARNWDEEDVGVSAVPFMNRGFARRGYGACHLAAERFKSGMSQKFLAAATGIRQPHISAMENGKRAISEKAAKRLAAAIGCNWEDFVIL